MKGRKNNLLFSPHLFKESIWPPVYISKLFTFEQEIAETERKQFAIVRTSREQNTTVNEHPGKSMGLCGTHLTPAAQNELHELWPLLLFLCRITGVHTLATNKMLNTIRRKQRTEDKNASAPLCQRVNWVQIIAVSKCLFDTLLTELAMSDGCWAWLYIGNTMALWLKKNVGKKPAWYYSGVLRGCPVQ